MQRQLVLFEGRPTAEPLAPGLAALAVELGVALTVCDDATGLLRLLRASSAASASSLVVVLGPGIERPLPLGRQVAVAAPDCRIVFVLDPARESAFSREAVYGAPPGGRWSLAAAAPAALRRVLEAELAVGEQQRRLRTTLDRMRLHLTAPAPVDSGEYRRLVASDRYLASLLRHAHDAIVSIDAGGRVVSWNPGAAHLFGLGMEQAQRQRFEALFRDPQAAGEAIRAALTGSFRSAELAIERAGALRHVEANFGALRDDAQGPIGVVAILRDVTERHQAEEELRASSRQKDEFLAMLAHELRNPLAPIRNAAQILAMLPGLDPHARRASDIIARQAEHMTALIDDLLDVARVTRGAVVLQREVLAMGELAADAVEQARGLMQARGHRFALRGDGAALHVHGDRKRLTQVLANLLVNAAKYTPEGGDIALDLGGDDAEVVVSVSDTGIGMDAALVGRVFDLFVQAERSPDRAEGGLGVGLALVRSLVAMHGGSVAAESPGPGQGSRFTVRLPRAASAAPAAPGPAARPPAAPSRPLELVVVDDNEDAAQTLGVLLRQHGHRVEVYSDPRAALERAASHRPDAYVLDIGMPHVDGYEFARRIQARHGAARPLLVALTGYGRSVDRERARQAGFDHHLLKPLDPGVLLDLLERAPPAPPDPAPDPARRGAA